MDKYLYFMEQTDGAFDADNDAVCYPVSSFQGFSSTGSTTTLEMHFSGVLGQDEDAYDVVTLTVTANTQKKVMQDIAKAINEQGIALGDGFIVISDDSNSVFASSDISACSIAVTAVD
tara:strand:- start:51 stop:404 length:354 start_codon:yes stop_codon:yes gene_type:complete